MTESPDGGLDEIDRIILSVLSANPRIPYSDIAEKLKDRGHDMSSEGIRYRVQNIFKATSTFFMMNPESHDWHVLRLAISVQDSTEAKESVIDELDDMRFWFISSGIGSFDIYAVVFGKTLGEVDEVIAQVRGIDDVERVDYFLETNRKTDMRKYLPIEESL